MTEDNLRLHIYIDSLLHTRKPDATFPDPRDE
jgi:hypothetical protein